MAGAAFWRGRHESRFERHEGGFNYATLLIDGNMVGLCVCQR